MAINYDHLPIFLLTMNYDSIEKVEQESQTKQTKRVQPKPGIILNLLVEAIWSPFLREEWY